MLDGAFACAHHRDVETAAEFLERLRVLGITQKQIGDVLGIAQSNAATFYTPGKNGKLRTLKWDEGVKLKEAFGLDDENGKAGGYPLAKGDVLSPMVAEIVRQAKANTSASPARPLAEALAQYLALLEGRPSIHANRDALEAVAQSIFARPLEAKPPA